MPPDNLTKNSILTPEAARRKIRRMAFEIAEHNTGESSLIVLGIAGNGDVVAQELVTELKAILDIPVETGTIILNKKKPLDARLGGEYMLDNKVVIVADDVSNSGRTLLYALRPLLAFSPKKIQTVVLVERSHKLFSVQPDFVGVSVATTLQEHITVETRNNIIEGAWLH